MRGTNDIKKIRWNPLVHDYNSYKRVDNVFCITKTDSSYADREKHPFKINMGVITVCMEGTVDVEIDMKLYHLQRGEMCFALPEQIVEYHHVSEDHQGYIILYSSKFFESINLVASISLFIFEIFDLKVHMQPFQIRMFDSYCRTIMDLCDSDIENKEESLKYLCISVLTFFKLDIVNHKRYTSQRNELSRKFMRLLGKNFKEHRDVQYYADEIHLSRKYLSSLIKKETGRTVAEWIDGFVILEAKNLLLSTDMTIKEISHELNFTSQSFFGKYFKRMTGFSPKSYKLIKQSGTGQVKK